MKRLWVMTLIGLVCLSFPASVVQAQEDVAGLQIKNEATEWRLIIPFKGRWSNWSMNNPTRLVVDLIEGRSKLPKSPGLWVLDLSSGPVSRMRTSQYSSIPGKRRVRITLDLKDAYRYEAIKSTNQVEILIKKPADDDWGHQWIVDVDRRTANETEITAREETSPSASDHSTDSGTSRNDGGESFAAGNRTADEELNELSPELLVRQPESRPLEGEDFNPALLESILGDSTLFEIGKVPMQTSWDLAAARLLDDAQISYLDGDTTGTVEKLKSCERFYADTEPGRQATLLRNLVLRDMGREVEADIGPEVPEDGPWLMVYDSVMEKMFNGALKRDESAFAEDVLSTWGKTDPNQESWSEGAIKMAETYLDKEQADKAGKWVKQAMECNPNLNASPRTLMLYAMINVEVKSFTTADQILNRVLKASDKTLVYRAKAMKGDIRYRTGKFDEAVPIYDDLTAPSTPDVEREWAVYQLGNCYEAIGDYKKAEKYLTDVTEDPKGNYWARLAKVKLDRLKERRHVANIR